MKCQRMMFHWFRMYLKVQTLKFSVATEAQSEAKLNSSRSVLELEEIFAYEDKFQENKEPAIGHILRSDQYRNLSVRL